ncbi:Na+/H+ antiporter subunit E [Palleronia sediminis]|uniref:Na+/H+ antiporter subunit E n=1 Tax=Palleronia sediminis TaxID=2547833 RepID=A0A4R6AIK1_9RHOB|nr:Na+/H+ antiporter subunit E [Palleronia sediminis]TDL81203.1 Na+/H+ antiporter subunit E [Palleronia sediminis]
MQRGLLHLIFPHPALTVVLLLTWCLLTASVSLGNLFLGLLLGILVPIVTAAYWPDRPMMRSPLRFIAYVFIVLWDILLANFEVAWIVLFRSNRSMQSNWIVIPLEIRHPEAVAVLAGTITLTPGTVSADLSQSGRYLLVHALDAPAPEQTAREIKHRYERRLKEIFE